MLKNELKNALMAVSLTLLSGPVVYANTPVSPLDQWRAEYIADQDKLRQIQANRQSIIQDIVIFWANESSGNANTLWKDEITTALNKASNEDLLNILDAESYGEVLGILRGDDHVLGGGQPSLSASAANNAIAPATEADAPADLVYTPVTPCRIYDTRTWTGGAGSYEGIKSYIVYSNTPAQITQMHAQGGGNNALDPNDPGCPAPNGEPSAISGNFTVVPGGANEGWITVYPFGATQPNSSLVNYYANRNIANAAIIATANAPGYDISVYHRHNIDSLADVMGYFYPATPAAAFKSGRVESLKSSPLDAPVIYSFGVFVKITTTTNNQKVFWTAHQPVGTTTAASNLNIWPCWKASAAADVPASWKPEGGGAFGITMTGIQRNIVSSSAVVAPGVGDYDFGLCYSTDDTHWNFNDWGYVAAQKN